MKRFLFYLCFFGYFASKLVAQEVSIKSIPYVMHFENSPAEYKIIDSNHIQISASAQTDLFFAPDGKYVINKSPRLVFKPDSSFILSSKIQIDFKANWDAGDLIIYNDNRHWAKFCFERDFKGKPRVVSVVCNNFADDCNSMIVNKNEIYYKILGSIKDNQFGLFYSEDGKSWFPIRIFSLNKTENLRIGFSVQSPIGEGSLANFSEINYKKTEIKDWRIGE